MTSLLALEGKLVAAKGPSREIDRAIFPLIGFGPEEEKHCASWCKMDGRTDLTRERYISAWAPDYTSSIDAALALVSRCLPGCWWSIDSSSAASVVATQPPEAHSVDSRAPTPALAICLALIRALAAKESGK